ncbi:MAG: anthranilate phosphoribosyltransferase [Candidatus Fimousia sp.]|uniref:anthranilate phosphoribosyltransferase n=1 Tax=Anaerostipes sp. 992a TaxID=1261637 RepID=UPI000951F62F|nr:anthranilate phosphoribosyltransferase [Anaerostipes sp. 992a]OLR62671.1 anthranilate phosphoribosyltransferase [Anaerostipes sp. 992a]
MMKDSVLKVATKENLSYEEMRQSMDEIMSGQATQVQVASFLTALSLKGETIEEITAAAEEMRRHAVHLEHEMDVLEIVGTGGDKSNSFNISTTSAFVISAAGIPVAKHGNRAASSKSGAADVLEALGVNLMIDEVKSKKILEKIGMCFLFAQKYHPAMRYVGPVRKELGIRTIFNILGPLTNPAGANMQLLGVYSEDLLEPMSKALANLGVQRGMVVYGKDGLDEISVSAPTAVCEIQDGQLTTYEITPEEFGLERCQKEDLAGGTAEDNAQITKAILSGEKGPKRNAVLLNSAAAIHIARPFISIKEAIKMAEELIDSGKAMEQLEAFVKLTNEE